MKSDRKKSFLGSIPSWALALIAMFLIFVVLMVIGESVKAENVAEELLLYFIWGIVNAVCCFFIVRQNPKSIWYVPLIINVIFIIPAIVEPMKLSDWIGVCGILVLSFIGSIIGARMGRKNIISDRP
jgi:peptidoglycan/LPS O-acetylase OafA/YrhL